MLLIFNNVFNATVDSMVVIRGVRMNVGDLATTIERGGPQATGPFAVAGTIPIFVTPFGKPSDVAKLDCTLRTEKIFGKSPVTAMSSWPDNDSTLNDLPSKFGIASTTPTWLGARGDEDQPRGNNIFFFVIPKTGEPIVFTKVELISYASKNNPSGPGQNLVTMPDGTRLFGVNTCMPPSNNPRMNMALLFSTYKVDVKVNDQGFGQEVQRDPFFGVLSRPIRGVNPAFGTPTTQLFLLPGELQSCNRDYLEQFGMEMGIPASPMVLYDVVVGPGQVVPTYRGATDFSSAELQWNANHLSEMEKTKQLFCKMFTYSMQALMGQLSFEDPELGITVNMKFDLSGE